MAAYSRYTDNELAALLKQQDQQAYTEIYYRYNRLLYAHAYKRLRNKEEAQDVVQEVFAVIWSRQGNLDVKTNLIGYLYTALRNRIYNLIAHKSIESEYVNSLQSFLEAEYAMTDHLVREKEFKAIIEAEIASLPARMRLIFELSRKQYLSHKEIAKELNISEQTVTDQVKKALKILKPRITFILYMLYMYHQK